ncbi:hypothetical protein DEJ45_07685 [Streptomyces venezuelae]|nr:hypothetical protein DEJ45_07685 [Streptomyces venezuelae]
MRRRGALGGGVAYLFFDVLFGAPWRSGRRGRALGSHRWRTGLFRAGPRSQLNRSLLSSIGPPHMAQIGGPLRRGAGTVGWAFWVGLVSTVPSGRVMVTAEAGGTE